MSFYQRYLELCRRKGVSPCRALEEAGLSRSLASKWKNSPGTRPAGRAIDLLTAYFGITATELLGDPHTHADPDAALKFALFGGDEDITPEMFEEVLSFAAFVKERERRKRQE